MSRTYRRKNYNIHCDAISNYTTQYKIISIYGDVISYKYDDTISEFVKSVRRKVYKKAIPCPSSWESQQKERDKSRKEYRRDNSYYTKYRNSHCLKWHSRKLRRSLAKQELINYYKDKEYFYSHEKLIKSLVWVYD